MKKHPVARYAPKVVTAIIVVAATVGMIFFVRNMLEKPEEPTRPVAQVVNIVRPPPPPPDQPPPPPPPEEKIDEPLPQDMPDEAPPDDSGPAEQLGLDAEGVAGSDGFGLAARRGGRDLVGGGSAFAWYTSLVKDTILDVLSDDERVRRGNYQVVVRVWLATDGRVERVALVKSTGRPELDGAIEQALARLDRVRDAPPLEMPQPVTLRIVSRG